MWEKFLFFLGKELITALIARVVEWSQEQKHKKEVAKQVKKVVKETKDDPKERARRIADMLNS